MKFADIPGQEEAKRRLRELADTNRVPHAMIIEGPEGCGKFALARTFIQYLGCSDRRDGEPCGRCPSCVQHQSMQHIDTLYSFPVVKKNSKPTVSDDYLPEFIDFVSQNPFMDTAIWQQQLGNPNTHPVIYVDEATELVRRLSFAAHSARYKSVVMWQADRLQEQTANKLLKVIEEPPGQTVIIMTTDKPMNILPTIYSRVQRIKVQRLTDDQVAQWMVDACGAEPEVAADTAPLANGSLNAARRILEHKDDSERFLDLFIKLMRQAYQRDIMALKDWSQQLAGEKRDFVVDFLTYAGRMIRENFVANLHRADLNLMSEKECAFSVNFARFVNERNAPQLFQAVNDAIEDIRGNANVKVVLFDFAITVILLLKN